MDIPGAKYIFDIARKKSPKDVLIQSDVIAGLMVSSIMLAYNKKKRFLAAAKDSFKSEKTIFEMILENSKKPEFKKTIQTIEKEISAYRKQEEAYKKELK